MTKKRSLDFARDDRGRGGQGEEGENLLGVLLEGEAAELVVGNRCGGDGGGEHQEPILMQPLFGGEEHLGDVAGTEQIAYHLVALGNEEAFLFAELLLFELANVFNLVLRNHYFVFCVQKYKKLITFASKIKKISE